MAFRAFFGLPVENFTTPNGVATNAVYGFTTMLVNLMKDHKPTHIAVAFDLPGGTFRTEILPSYKGTRDATPPDFEPQVPLIREVLAALGVAAVDKPSYEADDLLATYARLGREAESRVIAQIALRRSHHLPPRSTRTGLPVCADSVAASARICAFSPSRPVGEAAALPWQAAMKASSSAR